MRFITELCSETVSMLERIHKQSRLHQVRQRAHGILLSYQGYSVMDLTKIFRVSQITIYRWFYAWERRGLAGLYDKKGRGRKRKLNPDQQEKVREWAKAFPKNLHKVCALITENFGIMVSKKTIKRMLKVFHFSWRRIRQRVKGKPDPKEYEEKEKELEKLQHQDERGEIDLRYFDESGFCLTPYIPYAWQEKGEQIEVETSKSRRLNVLGFMNRRDGLDAYTIEGSVDSDVVIAIMDEFCKHLTKKTVVVIDNAPMHTSEAFLSKLGEWAKKGLEFFPLPPYSPQLNIIEILWRFMKYEWIDFKAYTSWTNLVAYVEKIIRDYGKKYIINFG